MRNQFYGFYPPTSQEFERLWSEALIVLDTNVLLSLYRLPDSSRNSLLDVLRILQDRIWIPHQVALEFQRRRISVIANERSLFEKAIRGIEEAQTKISTDLRHLEISKRNLGINIDELLQSFESAGTQLLGAIKKARDSLHQISNSDPIRDELDLLLESRIGIGPKSQQDLDAIVADGDQRYSQNIPPGFEDIEKDKKPREACFTFDHITYQSRYGDLILWRQLLSHVKEHSIKAVLFITGDKKPDWWWEIQGKTLGPNPELIREIRREASVDLFWMYDTAAFMEHAKKYRKAVVSDESVEDVKLAEELGRAEDFRDRWTWNSSNFGSSSWTEQLSLLREGLFPESDSLFSAHQSSGNAVFRWLSLQYKEVRRAVFPDLIAVQDNSLFGFEVKVVDVTLNLLGSRQILNSVRGGLEMKRAGKLATFNLVFVIQNGILSDLITEEYVAYFEEKILRFVVETSVDSAAIAVVDQNRLAILASMNNLG